MDERAVERLAGRLKSRLGWWRRRAAACCRQDAPWRRKRAVAFAESGGHARTPQVGDRRVMSSRVDRVFLLFLCAAAAHGAPLGPPDTVATYRLSADPAERPEFERERRLTVVEMRIGLGPTDRVGGAEQQWLLLSFARLNGQRYEAWLLMDSWPRSDREPHVARYLWQEPDWPDPVEFVNEVTGAAQLPRLSLWRYGWPQGMTGDFPEAVRFQGYPFQRVEVAAGGGITPPAQSTVVRLNPDLIIGHMTRSTDVHGKPYWDLPDGRYVYRKTTLEDHRRHFEAGFNLFQATPRTEWLIRSSAWDNNLFWLMDDWPAQLYRSNYWGRAVYVDEPAIHNRALNQRADLAGKLQPREAVLSLQEHLRSALRRRIGNYSQIWINEFIDRQFGRGDLHLVERDYPVWEALWTTAWYQLEVEDGVAGIVDEDAVLADLVESYNRAFGTQIPPTVENACAIRVAVLRGAARNFGKRWGVAFYSPAETRLKASSIPILYDKGASYFWVWTGWEGIGDNSGLPYSYQRYYASLVKQAQAANPRRDMDVLRNAATTCIVIPYGYTFAPYPLQHLQWLHLERGTGQGATYRQVLSNAAREVERCIRLGIEFDIAVDDPKFTAAGYEEVIRCREDGRVLVQRGGAETLLESGREPSRPDLGPGPTLVIDVPEGAPVAPGEITLQARATAGTGEFEGGAPRVSWEVYGPDQGVSLHNGETIQVALAVGGAYRVRAAVADVFGRPAIAWTELAVEESRIDAASFPDLWAFQTDPEDVGALQGWQGPEFDDSGWRRIPVPAWWENTQVGAYDGYAWYRVRFTVPEEMRGRALTLHFAGVDESAWVYLNGELIGERTEQSTGQTPNEYWDKPFSVPVKAVLFGEENVLAVRVQDSARMGGIFGAVRLYADR